MDFNLFYGKVKSGPLAFEFEKAKKKKNAFSETILIVYDMRGDII